MGLRCGLSDKNRPTSEETGSHTLYSERRKGLLYSRKEEVETASWRWSAVTGVGRGRMDMEGQTKAQGQGTAGIWRQSQLLMGLV